MYKSLLIGLSVWMSLVYIGCRKNYDFDVKNGYESYVDSANTGTIDTSLDQVDFSFLNQATIFPGLVGGDVPRLVDSSIIIDRNYVQLSTDITKTAVMPSALNSVGLYAPAGEPIKIVVKPGIYSLVAQIGAWTDDVSGIPFPTRYPIVYNRQQLFPGVNYVRNPFGGNLFITSASPIADQTTIQVTGAVRSPDFTLGVTNEEQWTNDILKVNVPWFILKSKHVMLILPRASYLKSNPRLTKPTSLMTLWDWIYENVYFKYSGTSLTSVDPIDQAPTLPMVYVFDKNISVGYWHSGFPIMVTSDMINYNTVTNYNGLNYDTAGISWGALHENGHNWQMGTTWDVGSVMTETTCNMWSVFFAHEKGISFGKLLIHADPVDKWPSVSSFISNTDTTKSIASLEHPFAKIFFYAQIFYKLQSVSGKDGWKFWPYLYQTARRQTRNSFSDNDRWDLYFRTLCDYSGLNMLSFFKKWGVPVTVNAQNYVIQKGYPLLNRDIWNYNPMTDTGGNNPI